jgi:flagellar biosynthesis protein FlhG
MLVEEPLGLSMERGFESTESVESLLFPGYEPVTVASESLNARTPECLNAQTPECLNARMPERRSPILALASGKGGVGKTFLSINLALAFKDLGWRCLLADLDWGLANVDVALGLCPPHHVGHVCAGEIPLADALVQHQGLSILPNACGEDAVVGLERDVRAALVEQLAGSGAELVVADTHPGVGSFSLDLLLQADHILLVTTPEPTSMTDSYALFKVLVEREAEQNVRLVVNQAASEKEAKSIAGHLDRVARTYLGRSIAYGGFIPADVSVARSVQEQKAVLAAYSYSPATFAVRKLAHRLASTVLAPAGAGGKLCRA